MPCPKFHLCGARIPLQVPPTRGVGKQKPGKVHRIPYQYPPNYNICVSAPGCHVVPLSYGGALACHLEFLIVRSKPTNFNSGPITYKPSRADSPVQARLASDSPTTSQLGVKCVPICSCDNNNGRAKMGSVKVHSWHRYNRCLGHSDHCMYCCSAFHTKAQEEGTGSRSIPIQEFSRP